MPRFSIVVPAFEAASTLRVTLDAVMAQSCSDWECIVVDDGSTDDTPLIAEERASVDRRIRVIRQANQGTAGAYNTGVSAATGEFVVICSADDVLLPDHLAELDSFIGREAGYDIYSTNGYYLWPDGARTPVYGSGEMDVVASLPLSDVIRQCFYSVGAGYRRVWFDRVGGYRRDVYGEDYDFWLRAMAMGARHRYLPAALSLHRMSGEQKSARLETVWRSDIRIIADLRRDFELTEAEDRAVADAIRERETRIAELLRPHGFVRDVLRPTIKRVLIAVLGPARTLRLVRKVRSIARPRQVG
ncbi:MAG TPA: glycosyltransferase family A protein [Candidatus Limnocylindrales bacterium]